jgi:hypothetical protein
MENSFVEKYHNHGSGDPPSRMQFIASIMKGLPYRLDSIYSITIGRDVKCQPLLIARIKITKARNKKRL